MTCKYNSRNIITAKYFTYLLREYYTKSIREERGGSYTIMVEEEFFSVPSEYMKHTINFDTTAQICNSSHCSGTYRFKKCRPVCNRHHWEHNSKGCPKTGQKHSEAEELLNIRILAAEQQIICVSIKAFPTQSGPASELWSRSSVFIHKLAIWEYTVQEFI